MESKQMYKFKASLVGTWSNSYWVITLNGKQVTGYSKFATKSAAIKAIKNNNKK